MEYKFDNEVASLMGIPDRMQGGLKRWLEEGIYPGSFLTAVLEGKLMDAIAYADAENVNILARYAHFLRAAFPPSSYGSEKKCRLWCARHRRRLENKKRAETEAPSP